MLSHITKLFVLVVQIVKGAHTPKHAVPPYVYVGLNEKQDGGYIQCISVQTLIFRLVMNLYVQRHLDLLSGVAPSYNSKETARNCC